MSYTHPEYLISTEALADAMQTDPDRMRLFDITVNLVPNPPGYKAVSGLEDFQKEHIPGANFLDLMKDFSDTSSKFNFMLPSVEHLQAAYRAAGISDDSQVVFYSSGHMMWATRAWWMLYSCGHKNVAVLDGSFARWQEDDRAVTSDATSFLPVTLMLHSIPRAGRIRRRRQQQSMMQAPALLTRCPLVCIPAKQK